MSRKRIQQIERRIARIKEELQAPAREPVLPLARWALTRAPSSFPLRRIATIRPRNARALFWPVL